MKNENFYRENEERRIRFESENYDYDYSNIDNFDTKSKDPSPFLNVYDPYSNEDEKIKEFEQHQNEYLDYEYNHHDDDIQNTEIIDHFDEKIIEPPVVDSYAPRVDQIRKTEYVDVIPVTVGRRFKVLNRRRPGPRKRNPTPKPNFDVPIDRPNFDIPIDRPFRVRS